MSAWRRDRRTLRFSSSKLTTRYSILTQDYYDAHRGRTRRVLTSSPHNNASFSLSLALRHIASSCCISSERSPATIPQTPTHLDPPFSHVSGLFLCFGPFQRSTDSSVSCQMGQLKIRLSLFLQKTHCSLLYVSRIDNAYRFVRRLPFSTIGRPRQE